MRPGPTAHETRLTECPSWRALEAHASGQAGRHLRDVLGEAGRYEGLSRRAGPVLLDFSRQRMTGQTLELLLALAAERGLEEGIRRLFAGEQVNNTEVRPALHMALRNPAGRPFEAGGMDVTALVSRELGRMLDLSDALASGTFRGHSGAVITDVVNIGIGGSDLGIVMALEALKPFCRADLRTHCVSNIDGTQLADLLPQLDPSRTLFIICSKTFTTLETQLNAAAARSWLVSHLPAAAVARHFLAVSVNDPAMDAFGIARELRFRIWDWVGGRYSLWSAVGLLIAIAVGRRNFQALLAGAQELDEHFRTVPARQNLPVLLGLIGVWNQNFLGAASQVILPYTQRLHRFAAFLQQLEMESNGKSVTRGGEPVDTGTGTIVWGEPGSNAQHAFFQLLHQGTQPFAADFVAPVQVPGAPPAQHRAGLANMLAQAEAFALGRNAVEVRQELAAAGLPATEVERLVPHKVHAGNRPSTVILLDRLDPHGLGFLIALYEHKVFVQSVIWGINPFDQWGVELGKGLARRLGDALAGGEGALPPLGEELRRRLGG
jgi:glucose-6-phosphate isomerase